MFIFQGFRKASYYYYFVYGNKCSKLECCRTDFNLISYNSILAFICYFLSVATASQQEQSGDFLSSVRVDENSQEMLFEDGAEQSAETKNR